MTDKPSKKSKKPLDYPLDTFGTRAAAKARKLANGLTREQRQEHFRRAMVLMYGGELKETSGAGH